VLALGFVALAGALVMAPASYHRQTGPQEVSVRFLTLASRLLLGAMILLVLGIGIDFYVIARVILANRWLSMLLTLVVVSLFVYVWFLLPRLGR
jgi:ABC-type transport system involved in Fe-S cluster assembly fused permease/ATPase subunit